MFALAHARYHRSGGGVDAKEPVEQQFVLALRVVHAVGYRHRIMGLRENTIND
jgi:hypothetical protein